MTEQELLELCPLAALGALDGEDRAAFEALLPQSEPLRAELLAFERIAALIPLALAEVKPRPGPRAGVVSPPFSAFGRTARPVTWLAAAAALAFAASALLIRGQRDLAREQAASLAAVNKRIERDLEDARITLAEGRSVRSLIGIPGLRFVNLAGQKPAPGARARALYDPETCEALLLVAGLTRAPDGKAYEIWVIAGPVPTPAGTFQVDEEGTALVRLPQLAETARVKTFAVSLEPASGMPAPTGPIVLAGNAP